MKIDITEVQTTCIILMGLVTLILAKFLPTYVHVGRKIHIARKLLAHGTLLITIHFCIQNILQKNLNDVTEIRTIVNLLFGIPISYCFNLSYLYLMRQGKIHRREWWIGPIALILAFIVLFTYKGKTIQNYDFSLATIILLMIYGSTLLFYRIELIKAYFKVKREIAEKENAELSQLIEWTRWSLLILVIVAFGFPFMAICTNSTIRAFYGILAISSSFIYIISFVGYYLTYYSKPQAISNSFEEKILDNEVKVTSSEYSERMNTIIEEFIRNNSYTTAGITLKDAAIIMGISCNRLRVWLRSTPYEKFNNWIVSLRIEKSKELLLKYPELNNEEIAEKCGFCDRQYFQYQFSKKEGVTPAKWLKEQGSTSIVSEQNDSPSFKNE